MLWTVLDSITRTLDQLRCRYHGKQPGWYKCQLVTEPLEFTLSTPIIFKYDPRAKGLGFGNRVSIYAAQDRHGWVRIQPRTPWRFPNAPYNWAALEPAETELFIFSLPPGRLPNFLYRNETGERDPGPLPTILRT